MLGDHFLDPAARVRVTTARQIQAGASRSSAVHIACVGVFAILDCRDSVNGKKMQCDLWEALGLNGHETFMYLIYCSTALVVSCMSIFCL